MTFTLLGPRTSFADRSFAKALPTAITDSARVKTNIFFIVVKFKGCTIVIVSENKGTTLNFDLVLGLRSNGHSWG